MLRIQGLWVIWRFRLLINKCLDWDDTFRCLITIGLITPTISMPCAMRSKRAWVTQVQLFYTWDPGLPALFLVQMDTTWNNVWCHTPLIFGRRPCHEYWNPRFWLATSSICFTIDCIHHDTFDFATPPPFWTVTALDCEMVWKFDQTYRGLLFFVGSLLLMVYLYQGLLLFDTQSCQYQVTTFCHACSCCWFLLAICCHDYVSVSFSN